MPAVMEIYTLLGGTLRIKNKDHKKVNKRMMYAISCAGPL